MRLNFSNEVDGVSSIRPGEFQSLPAGGYVCIVTAESVENSKSGNRQLILSLDIAEGEFARFFEKSKYPPKYYQPLLSNGKVSGFFKALIEDFENSNSDFNSNHFNFDTKDIVNKKIGFVFSEEEREYNGKIYTDVKPRFFMTVDKIRNGDFKVPPKKTVERKPDTPVMDDNDDVIGTPITDDNIPF